MAEALHSLGPKGREVLGARGWRRTIRLERAPPKNLEHFVGINDIRVAVEQSARCDGITVGFFFACWELQRWGWRHAVIPDAACHVEQSGRSHTVLFEYDRGEESPGYVVRTKFKPYVQGFEGFPFSLVVVVVETAERLEQLRDYATRHVEPEKFSFILHETLMDSWSLSQWIS